MSDMRRLIDIVSENRWADIGFSVRSDHLWPVTLMESKDAEQTGNFNQWLDEQRSAQKIPSENSICILAMILPSREEVYIMWGQAIYIGQNQTHYQLQIQSGIHEYSKRNQIVFDSKESFEKFIIALRLKYEDDNRKIELKQMSIMETSRKLKGQSKLDEINFSSSVGNLSISNTDLISSSEIDGTIGSRKVYLFKQGKNKIYFFRDDDKVDALVYLLDDRVLAMKNFSRNRGLIYNLFQYIINIKRQRVRLSSMDKLTHDGIKWIIGQIDRSNGFRITDANGNKINSDLLYNEWENARLSGKSGPTEIFISETKNSKSIRENESRLMPMDIFGSTLTESNEYTPEMPIMETSTSVNEDFDKEAEEYRAKLIETLPFMLRFFDRSIEGWRPSREQMLAAIETGYQVMKRTGDVKQAAKAMQEYRNTLHAIALGKKDLSEASDDSVDDITREFVSHYSEDPMGMFMHCKSSYLDAISRAKNFSMNAANLHKSHVNMSKQEFQDSIMKHFVPHLMKHNFPKHASDDWGAAEQDFMKSLMSDDLAEACWKGYHREGNKKMFGKTYPNCIKNTNEEQKDVTKESLNELAPSPGWDDDSEEISTIREIAEIIRSYIGDKFTVERIRDHRGKFNPNQPGYKFIPKDPSKYGMAKIWCLGDRRGGEYPTYNTTLYSYHREPAGRVIASGQHTERAVRKTKSNAYRTAELILNHTAGALKSDISESETAQQGMEVWQLGRLLGTTTGRTDPENSNRIEIIIRDSDRRAWIDRDWVRLRKPSQNS